MTNHRNLFYLSLGIWLKAICLTPFFKYFYWIFLKPISSNINQTGFKIVGRWINAFNFKHLFKLWRLSNAHCTSKIWSGAKKCWHEKFQTTKHFIIKFQRTLQAHRTRTRYTRPEWQSITRLRKNKTRLAYFSVEFGANKFIEQNERENWS